VLLLLSSFLSSSELLLLNLELFAFSIVNTRMAQKNFQLLIITHDEEFLDRLSKVDRLEVYYKVTRNEQ
jgi:DNA repair protein RAD50